MGIYTKIIEQARAIRETMNSHEDRMAFAQMMVDKDNYTEFEPAYHDLGQDAELEKILLEKKQEYKGLDAYIEAAQLELAWNIAGDFADKEEPEVCQHCHEENICELHGFYINCEHGDELFKYMEYLKEKRTNKNIQR